jgi:hypothetical protein
LPKGAVLIETAFFVPDDSITLPLQTIAIGIWPQKFVSY